MNDDEVYQLVYGPSLISVRDAESHYGVKPQRVYQWRARGRIESCVTAVLRSGEAIGLYELWRLMQLSDQADKDARSSSVAA